MLYFNKLHGLFIVYIVHIGGFCKNKEDFKDENPKITCPNYDNSTCISTNDQGGNVYTYLSDYKGKDGAVYISFGADGKPISIQWISLPKTNDEYTELCNTLTSDLNKQYGDAYFTNETAEATVWKDDSKAVTLFTINSNDSYTVSVNYAAKSAEEIAEAFKTDDANAAAELEAKSKVYRSRW